MKNEVLIVIMRIDIGELDSSFIIVVNLRFLVRPSSIFDSGGVNLLHSWGRTASRSQH